MGAERQVKGLAEYQKAFIGPYAEGHIVLKGGFYVPFNPAELSVEEAIGISDISQASGTERVKGMQRGRVGGMQSPMRNSSKGQNSSLTRLSVPLFFNTLYDLYQTSYADVRDDIRKLYPYTNASLSGKNKAGATTKAQKICFFWGTIAVAGMLEHMSVNYTMFAPDGTPVRAQVTISIRGVYVGEENVSVKDTAAKAGGGGGQTLPGSLSNWREGYQGSGNPRLSL